MTARSIVLTGGGTGGHVFPALAVAEVLKERGHKTLFIGTEQGMEARLVPQHGFEIQFVQSGGMNRVGLRQQLQTASMLPGGVWAARQLLRKAKADAVFSMGGYVAVPVMMGAILSGVPLIIMEPNAYPGAANRLVAKRVYRALVNFDETLRYFAKGRAEVIGMPVRPAFFEVQPKRTGPFTVLITGGSRGARTLNRASRESWPLFRDSGIPVRIIHQAGATEAGALAEDFARSGLDGRVVPFIADMPSAFADADLVIGRSGAGGVSEIAAAGMASVLVPFPFAADDHQTKNAAALANAGAARLVPDKEFTGERLFREVQDLQRNASELDRMRTAARAFAKPGAAERAVEVLEEAASRKKST